MALPVPQVVAKRQPVPWMVIRWQPVPWMVARRLAVPWVVVRLALVLLWATKPVSRFSVTALGLLWLS